MYSWKRSVLSGAVVAMLAVLVMSAGLAQAATKSWQIVSSPNVASSSSQLAAVAAVSAHDVWAVGQATTQGLSVARHSLPKALRPLQRFIPAQASTTSALIEQWNGTSWSIVPGATNLPTNNGNALGGLAVIPGTSNLWATGDYIDATTGNYETLIEQWDGTSWSVIPSPNYKPTTNWNIVVGVVALSATNAWTVGVTLNTQKSTLQTLIEHWNGTAWSIVRSSGPSTDNNILASVAAVSPSNIWAVGYYQDANGFDETLTEHWNGGYWAVVSSPNVQTDIDYNYLGGVARIPSSSHLWAVGYSQPEMCPCNETTLVEEWSGGSWSIVASPNSSTYNNLLEGVAALGAKNAWAVGFTADSNFQNEQTLIEQWDGTAWNVVTSPNVASQSNYLYGVTQIPGTTKLWSVGYSVDSNSVDYTLTEEYS